MHVARQGPTKTSSGQTPFGAQHSEPPYPQTARHCCCICRPPARTRSVSRSARPAAGAPARRAARMGAGPGAAFSALLHPAHTCMLARTWLNRGDAPNTHIYICRHQQHDLGSRRTYRGFSPLRSVRAAARLRLQHPSLWPGGPRQQARPARTNRGTLPEHARARARAAAAGDLNSHLCPPRECLRSGERRAQAKNGHARAQARPLWATPGEAATFPRWRQPPLLDFLPHIAESHIAESLSHTPPFTT